MAEKCTKTSSPVERWINPYPLAPLNHFTVPFSLTKKLLSPLLCDLTSASSVKLMLLLPPQRTRKHNTIKAPLEVTKQERLLSSAPPSESTAQCSGAHRGCASFDCETRHTQPGICTRRCPHL